MPNFAVTAPTARFEGDFRIAPSSTYTPTAAETAYLGGVNAAVDQLAADEAADTAANYPEPLLLARRAVRKTVVKELKIEVDKFTAGQNPAADPARVTEIRNQYAARLPRFAATRPSFERFDGDFELALVPGYMPGPDEQEFLDKVREALEEFAADKRKEPTADYSPEVIRLRKTYRRATANDLKQQVEKFWPDQVPAKAASEKVLLTRGKYQALRDRLGRRLFNVSLGPPDKRLVESSELLLDIRLFGGLPSPDDKPSRKKQELYIQINKADTVIRTVCDRLGERPNKDAKSRARLLRAEFLDKLQGIAIIGLELGFTALAKVTLDELRREFFVLEAGRIKNIYVRLLGGWAGGAALLLLIAYAAISAWPSCWPWAFDHRSFLLAACGASIGTWASFSIRQVQFSFDDLVMVEESALDPPVRILFVIVLTMTACLLFWNGAVNLEIGGFKTQPDFFKHSGSVALLVGLFAGLSERALATAISGRAAAFSKGIAGGT
jgi:hypothetical protein